MLLRDLDFLLNTLPVIRAQCDYGPVAGTAWIPKGIVDGERAEHTVPGAAEPRTANALKGHRLLKKSSNSTTT